MQTLVTITQLFTGQELPVFTRGFCAGQDCCVLISSQLWSPAGWLLPAQRVPCSGWGGLVPSWGFGCFLRLGLLQQSVFSTFSSRLQSPKIQASRNIKGFICGESHLPTQRPRIPSNGAAFWCPSRMIYACPSTCMQEQTYSFLACQFIIHTAAGYAHRPATSCLFFSCCKNA